MDEKPRVSYNGQSGLSQLATDAKKFFKSGNAQITCKE